MKTKVVEVDGIKIGGGNPLVLIAGPCVIENQQLLFDTAREIQTICKKFSARTAQPRFSIDFNLTAPM